MSRGNRDRAPASGNLSTSMRNNYAEHGVDEYYRQVHKTYRNPHFPGVKKCLFSFLNSWWSRDGQHLSRPCRFLDVAAGSGEATVCLAEWWHLAMSAQLEPIMQRPGVPRPRSVPPITANESFRPLVAATDPFTAEAFVIRTGLPCSALSFQDLANGKIPDQYQMLPPGQPTASGTISEDTLIIDIIVCSFALHLIESSSELFALLWELSTKARWLVILAPHKRPALKDGWGWTKFNIEEWKDCEMHDTKGEILLERVHCRLYRSLNCE